MRSRKRALASPRSERTGLIRRSLTALAIGLALGVGAPALAQAGADGLALVDRLGAAGDRAAVEQAVAAIERAPAALPDLDYALFRAGQACEDALADPARALALYERLVREFPAAGIAIAASRRAELLRGQIGGGGEHAVEAAQLAQLVASADRLAPAEIDRRARALADAAWPGAPDAALWHAEWLRRSKRFAEAAARFDDLIARWPAAPQARDALRGAAGTALDASAWDRAAALARRLPADAPADRVMREELLDAAARGRLRAHWYTIAWFVAAAMLAALAASFAHALYRAPAPRRVRIPGELLFLAPIVAVLVGVALTAHETIAPAVTIVSLGGLLCAGLSGAALEQLRAHGRPLRLRAALHVAASFLTVCALLYIVLMRDNLLDLVIETVRFGPEP